MTFTHFARRMRASKTKHAAIRIQYTCDNSRTRRRYLVLFFDIPGSHEHSECKQRVRKTLPIILFYFDWHKLILTRIERATYAAQNRNHTLPLMWIDGSTYCSFIDVSNSCNVIGLKALIGVKRVKYKINKREKMKSSATVNVGADEWIRSYFSIEHVIVLNRPLSRCISILHMRDTCNVSNGNRRECRTFEF